MIWRAYGERISEEQTEVGNSGMIEGSRSIRKDIMEDKKPTRIVM